MGLPRGSLVPRPLRLKISRRRVGLVILFWFGSWLLLNGLLFVHKTLLSDICTDDRSRRILQRLCEEYRRGVLTGDLCHDLCVSRTLEYERCLYYESGKKVMKADWRGVPVVLKSKLENFYSYENFSLLEYQDAPELLPMDIVLYATLEMKNSLGLEVKSSIVPQLWAHRLRGSQQKVTRAELASLWSLLQQEEYTFFRVLQDLSQHVVKVLGSCGHFYAVEYLIAGQARMQHLFALEELLEIPWRREGASGRRMVLHIALSFMHMIRHFEDDFTHRLHLCDVKPENFAVRKDLTVVAIDADLAFFEPKMRAILEQNCTSNEDCAFFDCSSRCDVRRHRCGSERINSNLQVICDKIFRYWFPTTYLDGRAGHPLEVKLRHTVQECAMGAGGRAVQERLLRLLTQLLQDSPGTPADVERHQANGGRINRPDAGFW
ncbi:divergent protein kinase domain 1C-like isoform X1 [Brienomyrus brachyistius]|uniref:divergent protein kinase domain 1C-like isoform X1 n=1 Tax=Brienomyrus brachyistius TaxID=42636 RepID=UPI0020B43B9C|nr:divergent protein kinase domain 1C-like isoform X1 [Brienomyrus brachyistius]